MRRIQFFYTYVQILLLPLVILSACHVPKNEKIDPFQVYAQSPKPRLFVPEAYHVPQAKKITHTFDDIQISLFARDFSQGNAVYIECITTDPGTISNISGIFQEKNILFTPHQWGFSGLFAIPPQCRPEETMLRLQYKKKGSPAKLELSLLIKKTGFFISHAEMDLGKYSDTRIHLIPENARLIKESTLKKREAFKSLSPNFINAALAHPRDMHYVTSPFWSTRIYRQFIRKNGKKIRRKSRIKIHRGLDLRGKEGTPVYAIAGGKVVLADRMFYEGNMLIIDHGNKIFSYFMHLKAIHVKKGEHVYAGMHVADVGSTGISTASHLHVSLLINGIQVDPLSILSLPIKD